MAVRSSSDSRSASSELGALSIKLLLKTALRSIVWLGIAGAITLYYPDATWPWYAAITLVAVGVLSSLYVLIAAIRISRMEGSGRENGR
jgi:hypothetical protein